MDDDARRKAKLTKLLEIEGYDRIEDLIEAVFSDSVSPAICMNEDCDFTLRNGAGPRRRLVRGVPHQHDDRGARSRRHHLARARP